MNSEMYYLLQNDNKYFISKSEINDYHTVTRSENKKYLEEYMNILNITKNCPVILSFAGLF